MALSDHGQYSGVVDIARNGIDEVIRLKAQAKADDALILQLVEALESARVWKCKEIHHMMRETKYTPAIQAGRARLEGNP